MKLSVIIVNYNVQYFLEQALVAVRRASTSMEVEVFVVDNNSVDESVEMVREKFPEVQVIANKVNVGFSKANNQAIKLAKGEYVLLLNPDTVVREDTFEKTIAFMDARPQAGALGVKMIDGQGKFLPESKRGFPTPEVAFYKAFGLSKLFPKSKKFNRYHLGYLDKDENHEVDVLSGAFMLMRKSVLDEIGYLDETFFMYGEDIDLSYRVIKGGYKNYYFADTTIIHYKGESTKKGSLNYVRTFYNAMIIFARKHFGGRKAGALIAMLKAAIYFRALLTLLINTFKRVAKPLVDAAVLFVGMYYIKEIWELLRFHDPNYFQPSLLYFNFPLYILLWIGAIYLRGGYDKRTRVRYYVTGVIVGSLAIAAIYGFLPSHLRASRMLIIFGSFWAVLGGLGWRSIWAFIRKGRFAIDDPQQTNVVIIGDLEESERVLNLLYHARIDLNFIGTVAPYKSGINPKAFLGSLHQLREIVQIYKVNEIIFCAKNLSSEEVIFWMTQLGTEISYKTVPEKSLSIIGSNSKNSAGDLYTIEISFRIASSILQRQKRVVDVGLSLLFLILGPLLMWTVKAPLGLWRNAFQVLFGWKSWVGYCEQDPLLRNLPNLRKGILTPIDGLPILPDNPHTLHRLNLFYAKDYQVRQDWEVIWKAWRRLGRPQPPEISLQENITEPSTVKQVKE